MIASQTRMRSLVSPEKGDAPSGHSAQRNDLAVLAAGRLLRRFRSEFDHNVIQLALGQNPGDLGSRCLPHPLRVGAGREALGLQLSYGYRTTSGGYPTAARALVLAEGATTLDPTHGEPVGFLAYIEYLTLAPLEKVRGDFDRAIKLRASEADVAGWNALMLLREGRTEQSLAESRRALELDPLSSVRHLTLALAALGARRYDLAGLEAQRAGEIEPELRRPRQVRALALLLQNRGSECVAMDLWPHLGVKAMCLRAVGREREAQVLVDSLERLTDSEGDANAEYADVVPAQELATYYAWIGNAGESLRYLTLAFERSPVGIDLRIVQSGVYDRVRNTPGFHKELQRLLDAVWSRVLEQRQRIQNAGGTSPITAVTTGYGPVSYSRLLPH